MNQVLARTENQGIGDEMQNIQTSEEYALERERGNILWEEQYRDQEQIYLREIDELLLKGSQEAHDELLQLFSNKDIFAPYGSKSNSIIEMIVVMDIYRSEVEMGEKHTILDMNINGDPLGRKALVERARTLRFLLWRMEFTDEADAAEKLLLFLKENCVSPFFLCKAVNTMAADEFKMLCEVMELVLDAGMLRHAYWLLRAMNEYAPEEVSIQQMIKELEAYAAR